MAMAVATSAATSSSFLTVATGVYSPRYLTSSHALPRRRRGTLAPSIAAASAGPRTGDDLFSRDPFPEEVESNFGDKVLGDCDTLHRILVPNLSALSLSQLPCEEHPSPLPLEDATKLLRKVVGWRIVEVNGITRLECLWKLREYGCGVELIRRIYETVESSGHYPNLHLEHPNQVRAELWTPSIGSLSTNDFIVAARIDRVKSSDLLPKKRVWA